MRTLYSKFVITTILIMLFSTIVGFMVSNTYYHQTVKQENDRKNMEIAKGMAEFAVTQDNLDSYLKHTAASGYQLYVINSSGQEKFYGGSFRDKTLASEVKEKVLNSDVYHGMENFPKETFVTGFFANELTNTVGVPFTYQGESYALFMRPNIELLFSEVHFVLGWMIIVMVILSIIAVLIGSRMLVNPIRKLSSATNKVVEEDFDVHLDINRKDEIGQLAGSFNEMIARLGELDKMRKSFISNVSHDIQSPLLNIQGYTRLLESNTLTKEEKDAYIQVIHDETNRMSMLTKQLLVLTTLDQKGNFRNKEMVDVTAQLKEIIQKYRWLLDEKEIAVSYSLDEVIVSGDPDMLYTVWENLLTNAIKYNRPDGSIELTIIERQSEVEIALQDTGIGLAPAEQGQIFERFYRADDARTHTTEGTGLGLSIVKQIIDMHGGRINVRSVLDEGTAFNVILPKM
ncbi:Signal transduction histidine kinase [Virgibacillus subterraneus]|uniref:Heme sensor protein HssS n=1 Tax=Virgibacillus subterraneus TaxID=621109 RepID=A0A1H9GGT4_9BACI|nr:HAMP domain-containing sensor histidine kinase [Virgibacillus subterraneus]SEQ49301.1 Signal transduction histidine kinase [Virgibacillus subterraneus]